MIKTAKLEAAHGDWDSGFGCISLTIGHDFQFE